MSGVLESLDENLWVADQTLRFFGLEIGSRMTVVRLDDGGLVIHSPIRCNPQLRQSVDALGPVKAIIAPSKYHHLSVTQWAEHYPDAVVAGSPGLMTKRDDVDWGRELRDEPDPIWEGQIDQVYFEARTLEDEVVFYHRQSQTMICADVVFNFGQHHSWITRVVGTLMGMRKPGVSLLDRVLIRDRKAAREQVDRMLQWRFDRMIVGHGPVLLTGGHEVLERAYGWL